MKNFILYRDKKVTIWSRDTYEIEANTLEEAVNKIIDSPNEEDCLEYEYLYDTEQDIKKQYGESTLEIIDGNTGSVMYSNSEDYV